MADCECKNWATDRLDIVLLTEHHPDCRKLGGFWVIDMHWKLLVKALVRGMESWAADEDGVHPEAWEAYKRAKMIINPGWIPDKG